LLKYPKHPITREAAWVLSPITMSLILASTMILLPPKLLPRPAKWLSLVFLPQVTMMMITPTGRSWAWAGAWWPSYDSAVSCDDGGICSQQG
jgi:hypothetical protein